ncbi:MAG: acyltransferase family protein [bacterium]|nr:acyltransferase family protein [bacterium]
MERNHSLDHAKFLLMVLVVFGHVIEPLIGSSPIFKAVYVAIYSFHMPAFVLISGLLSRPRPADAVLFRLCRSILVPLFIFTIFYELLHLALHDEVSAYTANLKPYWILWFLLALFVWRLALPYFLKLKYPLVISIAIGVGVGYIDAIGYVMSASRILYFLPFFIAGHQIAPAVLSYIEDAKIPKIVIMCFFGAVLLAFVSLFGGDYQALYGSFSYARLGSSDWADGIFRALIYMISFALSIALISLMPSKRFLFADRGGRSLSVYLLHGIVVMVITANGVLAFIGHWPVVLGLIFLFTLSLVMSLVLSSLLVVEAIERIVNFPFGGLKPNTSHFKGG